MKILSLFDGMSVAQQALKDAKIPFKVYYASEIDFYAIAVTQSNFPNTVQLGSVVGLNFNEKIDLLIGGSPCQDLSIAKKNRKGLDGERSGLFWKYVRIRNEVKPKYFVLENVNSMPKEAKNIITEALGVEPVMINASLVSAQNRKRLFWVGKWNGKKYKQVKIPQPEDKGILLKHILEPKVDKKFYVKDKSNTIRTSGRGSGINDRHNWDTIRIGLLNSGGQGDRIYSQDGKSVSLSANDGGRGAKTGLYLVANTNPSGRGQSGNIYSSEGKGQTLMAGGGNPTRKRDIGYSFGKILHQEQIRKLTPTECLRLQSMPDDYFDKAIYKGKPISNTQRYKMCGNAFNKEVIVHILKTLWS